MSSKAAMASPPRRPHPTQQQPARDFLGAVQTKGSGLPNRLVLHGVEGVGKTSLGTHAPKPIFGQARGETGLETLIDAGRVQETAHFPEWKTWDEVLASIRQLIESEHDYRTLVLDTLNGIERLCHEEVCRRDFHGDWTDTGFMGYQRGFEVALADWRELLTLLDRLRAEKGMSILALVHTDVSRFSNPEGPDFDRYIPALNKKTWGLTHKWADLVLFATFFTETVKEGDKAKGKGGQQRVLYTERHAAYDAKNRHGLPEVLDFGPTAADAWSELISALKGAKEAG